MPINPLSSDDSSNDDSTNVQTNPLGGGATSPSANAGSTGANVSGASTSASSGSGSSNAKAPSSTGFTNVNQYVNANADQAAGLGNTIAQNVNQQASQGLQGLSQAGQDFSNQVAAQSANPNTYSTANISQTLNNDINNPTGGGVQSDIQQYNNVAQENTNFAAGTNNTPSSLTQVASYSPADAQIQQAEQAANLTGTESGRATLLQGGTVQSSNPNNPNAQINITGGFSRPDYTTGQVNLDQLLLQNTPQNASTLTNLQSNLLGQYGLANTENQAIQNAATTRQNDVQGTQQAAQNIQDVLYGIPTGSLVDANGNPVYSTTPATTSQTAGAQPATPAQGPTATTTPIVNQQYGILTNLYNQLVAQPGQETAQQAGTLTQDQQNLTNYLTQTYGSNVLGIPIATLVQQAFSAPTQGAANIVNTMTPQQLAQLQTLNQFAGLNGTNINQIGPTGAATTQVIDPTQVGTNQFNPGVTNNVGTTVQNTINQAQGVDSSSEATLAGNALNQTYNTFNGPLSGVNGINTIINNATTGSLRNPDVNAQQSWAAYQTLNNQLSSINSWRQTQGLQPVSVTPDAINVYYKQFAAPYMGGGTGTNNDLTSVLNTNYSDPINWSAAATNSNIERGAQLKNAFVAAAQLAALRDAVSGLQNTNTNVGNVQLNYNPGQTYSGGAPAAGSNNGNIILPPANGINTLLTNS